MKRKDKSIAFDRLIVIMDILREKCPWDKKQTFETLRNHTTEECFELVDAIDNKDIDNIKEELGDILLHIVFYAKIADEQSLFSIKDVCDSLCNKLIYRHPHVFGDTDVADDKEVKINWEKLKQTEKKRGILDGVPKSLPAQIKAVRIQDKASSIGFDWEKPEDVWNKVKEEISEFEKEINDMNAEKAEQEFGDILFALTNAARLYNINPEKALQKTNNKFINRFRLMEEQCLQSDTSLSNLSLSEMEELWQLAKTKPNNY